MPWDTKAYQTETQKSSNAMQYLRNCTLGI